MKNNYINPDWENATKVHDWRNYINDELRAIWDSFSEIQKLAIGDNASELANREDWD